MNRDGTESGVRMVVEKGVSKPSVLVECEKSHQIPKNYQILIILQFKIFYYYKVLWPTLSQLLLKKKNQITQAYNMASSTFHMRNLRFIKIII